MVRHLTAVLTSDAKDSPHVVHLIGAPGSGRHFLARAAAHQAQKKGCDVSVHELALGGYEPGAAQLCRSRQIVPMDHDGKGLRSVGCIATRESFTNRGSPNRKQIHTSHNKRCGQNRPRLDSDGVLCCQQSGLHQRCYSKTSSCGNANAQLGT
jgi:hypothetical protein